MRNNRPKFLRQAIPPQRKLYAIARVMLNRRLQSLQQVNPPQHQHSADLPSLQLTHELLPFQPRVLILNSLYAPTRSTVRPIHSSSRFLRR